MTESDALILKHFIECVFCKADLRPMGLNNRYPVDWVDQASAYSDGHEGYEATCPECGEVMRVSQNTLTNLGPVPPEGLETMVETWYSSERRGRARDKEKETVDG